MYFINNSRIVGTKISHFFEDKNDCLIDGIYCKLDDEKCNKICNHKLSFMNDYQKKLIKTLSYVKDEKKEDEFISLFRCYKVINKTDFEVTFKNNKEECDKNLGIWDRKCLSNEECPFFMANKNRNKYRGGCKKGLCEFPLGINAISPRKYDAESVPLCGNCRRGYRCCEDQKDKNKYPNLLSPDYLFKN